MIERIHLQTITLRAAESVEAYRLYIAALEWGLIDPIIIDSRDDLKSRRHWEGQVEPYHHQVTNLITFCRRLPVTLLADDVGLGKTVSAGLIASELIARRRISRVLIVAPKLLGPQWKEELESKFGIPTKVVAGKALLDAEPADDVAAVVTTYDSARRYITRIPSERFEMLILDEAHKLRNLYGVADTPQVAKRFQEILSERRFRFVLMLTATPIQNRLWDMYSLIDLLAAARGHQNPFRTEGEFARRFIADHRNTARQLRPDAQDQFRSTVYSYMSRVRRGDANLHFPERSVLLRAVPPTPAEQKLLERMAKPIQAMKNHLAQISILQAFTSSPHALSAQLQNMARNGTFPAQLAAEIREFVDHMPPSAKLTGVATLVDELRKERPKDWRMVVFTHRRETQTTLQSFLETRGIAVGTINGDSGGRNQETLRRFRANPPGFNVLISTEAGSEGINLQVANVLVNFDLPWNPMIVEQRIGRIQRLASDFQKVFVYSVILEGTFEEFIVARLMEKLQLAAHAIGDIEALLEGSGLGDPDGDEDASFEEQIRKLVIASLAGKDVKVAVKKAEDSIARARQVLKEEEENINNLLDGMEVQGPRTPTLAPLLRSMDAPEFARAALSSLGATLARANGELFDCSLEGRSELVSFSESSPDDARRIISYTPGSPAFERLVDRVTRDGLHDLQDLDSAPEVVAHQLAREWVDDFGGTATGVTLGATRQCYDGSALARVRVAVAHDSYERLVTVPCAASDHVIDAGLTSWKALPATLKDPSRVGLDVDRVGREAQLDPAIVEFCRFYRERREEEVKAAAGDRRKAKKLEDEFTPRVEIVIVGLAGSVWRNLVLRVQYQIDGSPYSSSLTICPSRRLLFDPPELVPCESSGKTVPVDATARCEVSGKRVLGHLLGTSEASGRRALASLIVACGVSGKRALPDELEPSSVSGVGVLKSLLETSALSGRRAEAGYFRTCEFTQTRVLLSELARSDVSGRSYRVDQIYRSAVSARAGHASEFLLCALTGQALLPGEEERCGSTGVPVLPGRLEVCAISGKRVLPTCLERSPLSGKRCLPEFFVSSSVSGMRLLEQEAMRSRAGLYCAPGEALFCDWSAADFHPDDTRPCALTGMPMHLAVLTRDPPLRLRALDEMLNGLRGAGDRREDWRGIAALASAATRANCRIESAQCSPHADLMAVVAIYHTLLGFREHVMGFLFSRSSGAIVGRIAVGRRRAGGWVRSG